MSTNAPAPRFSIITPIYNTELEFLRSMVESVQRQATDDWELILVDDCSPNTAVLAELQSFAAVDRRVRVMARETNGGISAASNSGVDEATGDFVVLLDHDDELRDDALLVIGAALDAAPDADYLYSDEDKLSESHERYGTFRKPDWSPQRLIGQMYTSHVSVVRRELLTAVGGFRSTYDGSQDHDLILRVTERARRVVHVREVLYHWRAVAGSTAIDVGEKSYAWEAGRVAVQDSVERRGWRAEAERGPVPGTYRVRWDTRGSELTVVITAGPGASDPDALSGTVDGVLRAAEASALTIDLVVVVGDDPATIDRLRTTTPIARILPVASDSTREERLNRAIVATRTDTVVLLDSGAMLTESTLPQLLGPLGVSDVSVVGARIIGDDGRIVHAGYRYAAADYRNPYRAREADDAGEANALAVDREVSAVSSAALAARTEDLRAVGGFSARFTGEIADLDLGRKLCGLGRSSVASASAVVRLRAERRHDTPEESWQQLIGRWGAAGDDPFTP